MNTIRVPPRPSKAKEKEMARVRSLKIALGVVVGFIVVIMYLAFTTPRTIQHQTTVQVSDILEVARQRFLARELNDAEILYKKALEFDPDFPPAYLNLGVVYSQTNRLELAEETMKQALAIDPDYADALFNLALVLHMTDHPEDAEPYFQHLLEVSPQHKAGFMNYGILLREWTPPRLSEAQEMLRRAVSIDPSYSKGWQVLGLTLMDTDDYAEAAEVFARAMEGPEYANDADTHLAFGYSLAESFPSSEASPMYEFRDTGETRGERAIRILGRALTLRYGPYLPAGLPSVFGRVFIQSDENLALWQDARAVTAYLLRFLFGEDKWLDIMLHGNDPGISHVPMRIDPSEYSLDPTRFLYEDLPVSAVANNAHRFSTRYLEWGAPVSLPPRPASKLSSGVVTVGIMSGDLREHPVCEHTSFLFSTIDRHRFRVVALSVGPPSSASCRLQVEKNADEFLDLYGEKPAAAAQAIREAGVHVLIETSGLFHTKGLEILHHRPAPVTAHYLGFSVGTLGSPAFDFYLSDNVAAPAEYSGHFMEHVLRMPYSYHFAHSTSASAPSDMGFSRAEFGLPEDGIVFSCFNQPYKLRPDVFGVWMDLLRRVPGSVLWLKQEAAETRNNIVNEAAAAGVSPDRIVFAERMEEKEEHFARMALADLALDTWVYNGHTLTFDQLRAGVGVVTMAMASHASRVAASITIAGEFGTDLIASSAREYEDLSFELVSPGPLRDALDVKMSKRFATPLFDLQVSTRSFEAAVDQMWAAYEANLLE
eukprot:Rmarinus@m.7365